MSLFGSHVSKWAVDVEMFIEIFSVARPMEIALFANTVKPRKQEHSKIRTCRLILWRKTPKDKNQEQTDLVQCSYEMVHILKKFHLSV